MAAVPTRRPVRTDWQRVVTEAAVAELVRFDLGDGATVLVEDARPSASGPVRVSRTGDLVHEAGQSLQSALAPLRSAARDVLTELRDAAPDELCLEFGVVLTAQAGAVIAKAGGEAHLKVTMLWKRPAPTAGDAPQVTP